MPSGQLISCLKACKMRAKGFIFYVVMVKDLKCGIFSIKSVQVVREFDEVFPNDLLGVPPECEINFGIDLFLDADSISILPYRIAWLN